MRVMQAWPRIWRPPEGRGVRGRRRRQARFVAGKPSKFRSGHQAGDGDVEGFRNPCDVQHAHVAFASLDFAHVRPINPCRVSQRLLGKSPLQPSGTDCRAKLYQSVLAVSFDGLPGHPISVAPSAPVGHGIYDPTGCCRSQLWTREV